MDENYGQKVHPEVEKDVDNYEPKPVFTIILEFESHENMINLFQELDAFIKVQ